MAKRAGTDGPVADHDAMTDENAVGLRRNLRPGDGDKANDGTDAGTEGRHLRFNRS